MRPIDADDLKRLILSGDDIIFDTATEREIIHIIENTPTIEPEVRHGQLDEDKPLTNGDRIRQMTDEELAKFMCLVKDKLCFGCSFSHVDECEGISCEEARKKWIKQEVSEDAGSKTD